MSPFIVQIMFYPKEDHSVLFDGLASRHLHRFTKFFWLGRLLLRHQKWFVLFLILVLISLLLERELLFVYQAHCMWNRLANHSYTIFFASVSIFIPCLLILIAYLRIFFYAHKSRRNIKSNSDEISHSVKIATSLFASFALFTMCW
jgi:hypothetical protein